MTSPIHDPGVQRLGALAVLLVGLVACSGVSEQKLYKKLYKKTCRKAFQCDRDVAEEEWGSRGECREAFEPEIEGSLEYYAACNYRPRKARKYLRKIKRLDCDASQEEITEVEDAWSEVYDCL